MSDADREAANRLLARARTVDAQDRVAVWADDAETVARYALEAADRQAALTAEVGRLRAALARAHNEGTHATRCAGRIGGVLREIDPDRCDCWRSSVRAVLAPDTAPAVAPGAEDAGETSASA
jgi:multidrug efflux pump subunit AcrA (membrane-fusion protein)